MGRGRNGCAIWGGCGSATNRLGAENGLAGGLRRMAMSWGSKSMPAQRGEKERETNRPKNSASSISLRPPWGQHATDLFTLGEMIQ